MFPKDHYWNAEFAMTSELFKPLMKASKCFEHNVEWPNYEQINSLFSKFDIVSGGGKKLKVISPHLIKDNSSLSYEMRCYATGELETRASNWHDFLNALVWLTFPHTKAALNRRHYHANPSADSIRSRSPEQDALTLFDECGVIVISSEEHLLELIKNFSWKEIFWKQRTLVSNKLRAFVFGHGLYEQALKPYIGLTGKALLLTVDKHLLEVSSEEQIKEVDLIVQQEINDCSLFLRTSELNPLPILGIPGWYLNQNENFYDNKKYFREGRKLMSY